MSEVSQQPIEVTLELHELETADQATQARVALDEETVEWYAQQMGDGVKFKPIVVYYDGDRYWVADGRHRIAASEQAGKNRINCLLYQGRKRAAVWFSIGANAAHGKPPTKADKRKAVLTALGDEEWAALSDREIANHCGCERTLVRRMRKEQAEQADSAPGAVGLNPTAQTDSRKSADATNGEELPRPAVDDDDAEDDKDALLEDLKEPYSEAVRHLSRGMQIAKEIAGDPDAGRRVSQKITRIVHDVTAARGAIKAASPVRWCPACDGAGCDKCFGSGFLTSMEDGA